MLEGNVLITGGAGFLGRGILRRAQQEGWPARFTVFSRDEEKQWKLAPRYPNVKFVLGSVEDPEAVMRAAAGHDVVIHAAAVKFVVEAEFNVATTMGVNTIGTYNVARAAARYARRAVFISTDKACLPANLYGASKMMGERIWSEATEWGDCIMTSARYGNVIGSTGSIVPLFQRQLETTGRASVTDPSMTRFWMTVHAAVDVILAALSAPHGAVVAHPCPAMSIGDLAATIVRMSGLCCPPVRREFSHWAECDPSKLIDIVGARPGEKIHETLLHEYEIGRTRLVDGRFVIGATGTPTLHDHLPGPYSSDQPWGHVTPDDMIAAIMDARSV